MKKHLVSAAILAVFGAGAAFAQGITFGQSLPVDIEAEVGSVCGAQVIRANGGDLAIDFNDLASTPAGTQKEDNGGRLYYVCNSAAGLTRTFTSTNGGFLYRAGTGGGANNQIPWTFQHRETTAQPGLAVSERQLTDPFTGTIPGSAALLAGLGNQAAVGGPGPDLLIRAQGVQVASNLVGVSTTNVFAGDYRDVLTIGITPN
jgi:hypothetical protein